MSTSKPRSANAVAMTFWPRSWPSWPIFATRMRGRRPSRLGERVDACAGLRRRASALADLVAVHARDRTDRARCAGRTPSPARRQISPTVALARAASTASVEQVAPSPRPRVRRSSASQRPARRAASGLVALGAQPLELGDLLAPRTALLSTLSTSIVLVVSSRYLFTPMTGWRPESMRAWVRAAASSMRSLGMPASMALAMPPTSSTSSMCARRVAASSWVSRST